jgi:NAD(P)-dependent dehydrogenase (short-subunit alcohol dehydrogenase family)
VVTVVLLASHSITGQPGWAGDVAVACLRGDERAAREAAARHEAVIVYPASKAALAWWARREGAQEQWIGAGIRLDSVAPGKVTTAMTEQLAADCRRGRGPRSAVRPAAATCGSTRRPGSRPCTTARARCGWPTVPRSPSTSGSW